MKGDIKIGGNMNKKFWLEFTPWMYHVDIDLKHGQIIFTKRRISKGIAVIKSKR